MGKGMDMTADEALSKLKKRYDGYHFSKDMVDIYNPFSVVKAIYSRDLRDFWFQSGTPTRLINQFLSNDWGTPDLEGTVVSTSDLDSGDVLGSNLALACYYTGYLTIKGYDVEYGEYTLGYPN